MAFSSDGKTLAAGYRGPGGGVVLWDVTTRKRLVPDALSLTEGELSSVAFSSNGKLLAVGYRGRRGTVQKVGAPPGGPHSFVGHGSGGVVLWDMTANKRLVEGTLEVREGRVSSVAFSSDGKTLAAGYEGNEGQLYGDAIRRKHPRQDPLQVKQIAVFGMASSSDGKTLAALDLFMDGGVVLWDTTTRRRLAGGTLRVKESLVESVAFSGDGKTLAAGCRYHRGLVLWDVTTRKRLTLNPLPAEEEADLSGVSSVAFSSDGKTLAAGHDEGGVVLWNVTTRKPLALCVHYRLPSQMVPWEETIHKPSVRPVGTGVDVSSVAFSSDGKILAAGYAGRLVLWDVTRNERSAANPLPMKEGLVESVAFSSDGKTLAAGYYGPIGNGGVALWDVTTREPLAADPESWQRHAGQIANRNLTRAEWQQYFPEEPYHQTFEDLPVPPEEKPSKGNRTL